MMMQARSWMKDNSTLLYFLLAQALALAGIGVSIISYMVKLESRVLTLETRGSPHLSEINNRLTVLESVTRTNKDSLDRVVDIMTKELRILPTLPTGRGPP
jgi:hypothetical protein